ncbi:MAG: hypothetical protein WD066_06995 [Planctomycetaceae bacterium]
MTRRPRRIHRELTPDERSRLDEARERIAAELPDLMRRNELRKRAAEEDTFSGELRRAIHQSGVPISRIARSAQVTPILLDEFLCGESTPSTACSRYWS